MVTGLFFSSNLNQKKMNPASQDATWTLFIDFVKGCDKSMEPNKGYDKSMKQTKGIMG